MGPEEKSKERHHKSHTAPRKRSFLNAFSQDGYANTNTARFPQPFSSPTASNEMVSPERTLEVETSNFAASRAAIMKNSRNQAGCEPGLDPYDLTGLDGPAISVPSPSRAGQRSSLAKPALKPENEKRVDSLTQKSLKSTLRKPSRTGTKAIVEQNAQPSLRKPAASKPGHCAIKPHPLQPLGLMDRCQVEQHHGTAVADDAVSPNDDVKLDMDVCSPAHNATPRHNRVNKAATTVKVTYGSRRSILREVNPTDPVQSLIASPAMKPTLPSDQGDLFSLNVPILSDDSDEDTSHKGAVQSIHELRQAGANNRYTDEIDDLLERVGLPQSETASLRRNALLEIATKLHEKRFLRQFKDYGPPRTLFDDLSAETDPINAFSLISALLTLLGASVPIWNYKTLQDAGICRLLARLLQHHEDIFDIATRKELKLSRKSQQAVAVLGTLVGRLSFWPSKPTGMSPHRLALMFMFISCRSQEGIECLKTSSQVIGHLLYLLKSSFRHETSKQDEKDLSSHDRLMVATILEELSGAAVTDPGPMEWPEGHHHTISNALDIALKRPATTFGAIESSILKLAMNTTNNSAPAASIWQDTGRFQTLVASATSHFNLVKSDVANGQWNADLYNRLLLILGVTINICEHVRPADPPLEDAVLEDLIQTFLDNSSLTREVGHTSDSLY
ncbi:unnamed protein product [Parascedosporium putredinis]|uniref:Wings apart-like protein C-terminal domain-containing protein n=1 Tax=Parascedosporium putredinis TaxID=1442378 RepID=A0A9P1M5R8_9PEZI|nr:unnamed protein product [Parascedosporium putredinis]CAI7988364.1 unnamed protein product [Parascedosporium putredinis]